MNALLATNFGIVGQQEQSALLPGLCSDSSQPSVTFRLAMDTYLKARLDFDSYPRRKAQTVDAWAPQEQPKLLG